MISESSLDSQSSSGTSKSNTGSWTFLDPKECANKYIAEEIQTGDLKDQGRVHQTQEKVDHGRGYSNQSQEYNVTAKNKVETESKQGKLKSTFSNLKKMKFGKRQVSEPGTTNRIMPGNTVYCCKCKMVSVNARKQVFWIILLVNINTSLCLCSVCKEPAARPLWIAVSPSAWALIKLRRYAGWFELSLAANVIKQISSQSTWYEPELQKQIVDCLLDRQRLRLL